MIRVAVGIIMRGEKFLVAKRPPDKPYSGYWEFPGGKIEASESGEAALKRELHEELDIEVLSAQKLFEHSHIYPDKTVLLEIWQIQHFIHEPKSKENQELRFVTYDEMVSLRLLEGNWAIMDKIRALTPSYLYKK